MKEIVIYKRDTKEVIASIGENEMLIQKDYAMAEVERGDEVFIEDEETGIVTFDNVIELEFKKNNDGDHIPRID